MLVGVLNLPLITMVFLNIFRIIIWKVHKLEQPSNQHCSQPLKVVCMSLVCSRMSSLCHSYVFVCHPFVTRMYSYVILLLLVCICMTSFYYSYFLACHTYVTRVYLYLILLLLVCTRVSSFVTLITYL